MDAAAYLNAPSAKYLTSASGWYTTSSLTQTWIALLHLSSKLFQLFQWGLFYLKEIQYPQFIYNFPSYLIHRVSSKINVRLAKFLSRTRYVLLPNKVTIYNLCVIWWDFQTSLKLIPGKSVTKKWQLTVKLSMEPIKLPSSYLANLDKLLSRTDMSLLIRPCVIPLLVFSIKSSIFVWYWCCNKNQHHNKITKLSNKQQRCN